MRKNCSQVVLENFFEPCVLFLLSKKESYGYELIRSLNENCYCDVNAGNLYRTMKRLVGGGFVSRRKTKSDIGPDRVIYTLTETGKKYLGQWIVDLERQNKAITNLINNYRKI